MAQTLTFEDTYVQPRADEPVSLVLLCEPASGRPLDDFRARLTLKTLQEFLPDDQRRARVAEQLRNRGFEVFAYPSPLVSARAPVALVEATFDVRLVKRLRRVRTVGSEYTVESIIVPPGSQPPTPREIEGVLLVVVTSPGLLMAPSIPPPSRASGLRLRLPGDVAQLTRASATHRLTTPSGAQATGRGVGVAVIDSGFGTHPYYQDHGYRINLLAAPDAPTSGPGDGHGTWVLAGLLACAPDVDLHGIEMGSNPVLAFDVAMDVPGVRVMSASWVYDVAGEAQLPDEFIPLRLRLLTIIDAGVTVVVAAGNGENATFPAGMPEVIAVGGVSVDQHDGLSAWDGASSFSSAIFGRDVPDLCGLSSDMVVPIPGTPGKAGKAGKAPGWKSRPGGTSAATAQVAGIAALLLQKSPSLTPASVLTALVSSAVDIVQGTTLTGDTAAPGADRATGAGFVNAKSAWQSV